MLATRPSVLLGRPPRPTPEGRGSAPGSAKACREKNVETPSHKGHTHKIPIDAGPAQLHGDANITQGSLAEAALHLLREGTANGLCQGLGGAPGDKQTMVSAQDVPHPGLLNDPERAPKQRNMQVFLANFLLSFAMVPPRP